MIAANSAAMQYINRVADTAHRGDESWYYELICGYAACRRGDLAGDIWVENVERMHEYDWAGRHRSWIRTREAILKLTVILGQSIINSAELSLLRAVEDEDAPLTLRQKDVNRDVARGMEWILLTQTAAPNSGILQDMSRGHVLYPEKVRYFTYTLGSIVAYDDILSNLETTRLLVICLLCAGDVWWAERHIAGMLRCGGTRAEVMSAIDRAAQISRSLGKDIEVVSNLEAMFAYMGQS